MDKLTYNNTLRTQCFSLPDLCADQIDGVKRGLLAIPTEMLKTCSRIIVTGCGDSYVAAKASIPAFEKFGGRSASYLHERTINVARYLPLVGNDHADTLVIVGKIITASTIPAARTECPTCRSNTVLIAGTSTVRPTQPYTTDGIPAKISTTGR